MKSTTCYLVLCIDEARTFLGLFKRLPFGPFSDVADFTPASYDPVVVSETFYFFIYNSKRPSPLAQGNTDTGA